VRLSFSLKAKKGFLFSLCLHTSETHQKVKIMRMKNDFYAKISEYCEKREAKNWKRTIETHAKRKRKK
jgi:hypothetical protein